MITKTDEKKMFTASVDYDTVNLSARVYTDMNDTLKTIDSGVVKIEGVNAGGFSMGESNYVSMSIYNVDNTSAVSESVTQFINELKTAE